MDAEEGDASPDSGLFPTPCGAVTCPPEQYCHVNPTGACAQSAGAQCAPAEETCQQGGDAGCTTPRLRECRDLPAACPTAECACLINQNLCPLAVQSMCRHPAMQGATIECPFP
jgi:hypothetical protein